MSNKTLEEKIAELTAKHNLEQATAEKLPGLKVTVYPYNYRGYDTEVSVNVYLTKTPIEEIPSKIQQVLAAYPPSRNHPIATNGRFVKDTASPYCLNWRNGVIEKLTQIDYISDKTLIHIEVPQEYYDKDLRRGSHRKVNDTEYHYYPGESASELGRVRVPCQELIGYEADRYYGGYVTNYITNPEHREEWDRIVLTGKK